MTSLSVPIWPTAVEVSTADLSGEALAWAVGQAEGLDLDLAPPGYNGVPWRLLARYHGEAISHTRRYDPQDCWALGGALLDKHLILLRPLSPAACWARLCFDGEAYDAEGKTPLEALCRALVAAKLGAWAWIPQELLKAQTAPGDLEGVEP